MDENWKIREINNYGDVFFRCKVGYKDKTKFTPCSSNFTSFVRTDFFFLAGFSTHYLLKDKIINTVKEAGVLQKLMEIEERNREHAKNEIIKTTGQKPALEITPEFDGVYVLTTDNSLIGVPMVDYEELLAKEEISENPSRKLRLALGFETKQYLKIPTNKFKALIIKGFDLSNIEMRLAMRQVRASHSGVIDELSMRQTKTFPLELVNVFKFYPDEKLTLLDFKRKTLDKSTIYFEPVDRRTLGNINRGTFLLISNKSSSVTWPSYASRKGSIDDKPIFWLIGSY